MRNPYVVLFLVSATWSVGCRDRNTSSITRDDAAVESSSAEEITYPVVIKNPPQRVVDAANAAAAVSDAHDAACALTLDISPTLVLQRPESLGCPRDPEKSEGGAQ